MKDCFLFQFYNSLVRKLFEGLDPNTTPPKKCFSKSAAVIHWPMIQVRNKNASGWELRLFYKLLNPG